MHAGACEAAAAVRLAAEHQQSDAMIEWLFSHQETLTPQTVEAQVKSMFGIIDFDREYQRVLPDIKRDAADGAALHVQYTPTYYVNGIKAQLSNGSLAAGGILPLRDSIRAASRGSVGAAAEEVAPTCHGQRCRYRPTDQRLFSRVLGALDRAGRSTVCPWTSDRAKCSDCSARTEQARARPSRFCST